MEGRSTGRDPGRRVTMQAAAEELGVSVEAIRKRVQRDSIRSDKGEDGRRYVYLDVGRDTSHPKVSVKGDASELIVVLRAQVEDLRSRLDRETEANRENRRIIAGLIERVPEIEAPREERRSSPLSPEEVREGSAPGGDRAATEEAGEHPERRPWWRRVFGS